MPGLTVEAPAKINLYLRIGERRADGYHGIESLFVPLAFGDTLRVGLLDGEGPPRVRMEGSPAVRGLPPGDNILYAAFSLFREKTGFCRRLDIEVTKRIPMGGGLGGGSSDAAALLAALDRLSGAGLPGKDLRTMAEKLGSDVPFFLLGGAALAGGRGECLAPVDFPAGMPLVLVNPGFASDTAAAYRRLDRLRPEAPRKGSFQAAGETESDGDFAGRAACLESRIAGKMRDWPRGNDFLPVFRDDGENGDGAVYTEILSALDGAGADFSGLSGSGSTCFGIFTDGGRAETAADMLSKGWPFVRLTFSLRAGSRR
ncbi:MAG: 4-(cytidine 5'-diphospho)-2-C-methyl-D-erythritol kinase [Treponema sp.]|jgi:4-diphosphocytidyl-2-C-methyl-D-erythritol kinase|nr:4-(cytidine 5'-diphospho)-2-C-methyl-D-erythritol kinase [Treponema sp.]